MDPPRHREVRTLVNQAFTPRVVAGLEPQISEVATSLLDDVGDRDTFDLVEVLAYPLPVTVIAGMFGVGAVHAGNERLPAGADCSPPGRAG
jgi:cytochrome P450